MIGDGDHQLCEQQLSSLIPVLDQMRLDLDNTQAEISTVTLPLQPGCKRVRVGGTPMTAGRTFTNGRRPPIRQPAANSRSAEFWSNDRRSTSLQIRHTCQKEL